MAGYLQSLIRTESGGDWAAKNNEMGAGGKAGHFGRVQFGHARLQDAMNAGAIPRGTTPEQFMASPDLQMAAEKWHFGDLESQLGGLVGSGSIMQLGFEADINTAPLSIQKIDIYVKAGKTI